MSSLVSCWRLLIVLLALAAGLSPAKAIESVRVPIESQAIDLSKAFETYHSDKDRLLVSTAPGSDGIVRRIEVRARDEGTRPDWIVFALTNDTSEQMERLLVAPHFRLVGSGVIWPDLGSSRISAVTASEGFPIERDENVDADVFRLTLEPGTTVTYVAELRTPNLPQLYLWEPEAYKRHQSEMRERAKRIIQNNPAMVYEFLIFAGGRIAVVLRQICLASQICRVDCAHLIGRGLPEFIGRDCLECHDCIGWLVIGQSNGRTQGREPIQFQRRISGIVFLQFVRDCPGAL